MSGPKFVMISEVQMTTRRDFPLADSTLLQPLTTNPLYDGEWLELDTNYKLARGAVGVGGTHEGDNALVFPVLSERGRYDTQSISKVPVIMFGMFEAETEVTNTAGMAVGDALTVQDVTVDAQTKRGLLKMVGNYHSGVVIVGYVSRLPGGGKVRFVHFGNQKAFA